MSKGWERSRIPIGTRVRIPDSLFVEPTKAKERLVSATIVGETDSGLIIDCVFRPGILSTNKEGNHYKITLNWASIWCGQLRVYFENGEMLRAYREVGMPVIELAEENEQ